MIAKSIRQEVTLPHSKKYSLFYKYEAQKRRIRFISDIAHFLFSYENFKILLKEISELIISALTGSEEAYLDKMFFRCTNLICILNNNPLLYKSIEKN